MLGWRRQYKIINSDSSNMKYQNMECKKLVEDGAKTGRLCIGSIVALICIIIIILLLIFFHPYIYVVEKITDDSKTNETIIEIYNGTSFLLNPKHLCSSVEANGKETNKVVTKTNAAVRALVLITSSPKNWAFRQAIRETWGTLGRLKETLIRIAFVIGTSRHNKTLTAEIAKEHWLNKDIIQPDIEDNEKNQTLKSAALLRWAANYCPNAHYIIKAEDNTFVDMNFLLKTLTHDEKYKNGTQFIGSYNFGNDDDVMDTFMQKFELDFENGSSSKMYPYKESTYIVSQCAMTPLMQMITRNENKFFLNKELLNRFGIQLITDDRLSKHPPPDDWQQFKGLMAAHGYDPLGIRSLWPHFINDAITQILTVDSAMGNVQSSCT